MSLENKKIIADNIKRLMKSKSVNASIVCSDLNISMSTFSDWCNAKTYPRIDKIELLSNYFNVQKSELVEEYINPSRKDVYRDISKLSANSLEFLKSVTPTEIKLLKNYRAASEKEKRIVNELLNVEERRLEKPGPGLDELKNKSIEYAKKVILSCVSTDEINQLFLYGSYARNEPNSRSDVDLALFIKPDTLTIRQKRQLKSEAMPLDIHLPEVDLHVFDGLLSEFEGTYFDAIRRDGKEIPIN